MNFEDFNSQHVELDEVLYEEGLRDWFGKSKSKDGKKGWVNVVTGDSCASDKPGEGVPKCVSSSKRASMSKAERNASAAKKRREDPGQQSKSGAAKPTNVKTDVKEEKVNLKGLANSLDKSSKKHAKQADMLRDKGLSELKCWKGYHRKPGAKPGTPGSCIKDEVDWVTEAAPIVAKMAAGAASKLTGKAIAKATAGQAAKGGLRKKASDYAVSKGSEMAYNKVKDRLTDNGDVSEEVVQEDDMKGMSVKSGHKRSVEQGAGLTKKGAAAYRRKNPGSKLGTAVTTPPSKLKPGSKDAGRRKSFCARSRGWDGERGKAARRRWNC